MYSLCAHVHEDECAHVRPCLWKLERGQYQGSCTVASHFVLQNYIMCVCVHVCVSVCMHECVCVYVCVHVSVYVFVLVEVSFLLPP